MQLNNDLQKYIQIFWCQIFLVDAYDKMQKTTCKTSQMKYYPRDISYEMVLLYISFRYLKIKMFKSKWLILNAHQRPFPNLMDPAES